MDAIAEHGRTAIEKGSSSFSAAARLFGPSLREDVWRLYAWCRHCDDEIDGQDHGGTPIPLDADERARRLTRLRALTDQALSGVAVTDPAFKGLQDVATRHDLDPRWPREMLDGLALDVGGPDARTQQDTLVYCWGVAGVVGVMMAQIMGVREAAALRRAQDLGLAFQLTNICRDVREDALNGRVYLPAEALIAAGVAPVPDDLLDSSRQAAVFAVVRDQLTLAEAYYDSARAGLRALPFRGALAVAAARRIYRRIGRRILAKGPSALGARMRVGKPSAAGLILLGMADAVWSRWERLRSPPPRAPLWSRL